MKDSRLVMLMVVQTRALEIDRWLRRSIAAEVVGFAGIIPEAEVPDGITEATDWAIKYTEWQYGRAEQPAWFKDEWFSEEV